MGGRFAYSMNAGSRRRLIPRMRGGRFRMRLLLVLGIVAAASVLYVAQALAADTGFHNPSAQTAAPGGNNNGFEVDPTKAFTNGAGDARNMNGAGDRHVYYNFGFSILASSLVEGIEVKLDWWLDSKDGENSMKVELSWDGGATWTAPKSDSTETTSEHTKVLGGPTDTWGRAWTAGELSNASFRVRLTSNSSKSSRDFYIDWVPVKVYYTPVEPNPALPEACGVDMVLVIDSSASINATELAQMKAAVKAFVGAFLPSTPTQIALVEFDNSATVRHVFTGNAGDDDGPADTDLYARIDQAASGGRTNWDDALFDARSLFPNRPDHPDLIVFASDGNPNNRGGHNALGHSSAVAQATENAAMEWAIEEANAAKSAGIRIVALGIGGGSGELEALDVPNLKAISGPNISPPAAINVYTDVILANFGSLADALAGLAQAMCGEAVALYILEPGSDDSGSGLDLADELIFEAAAENMLPGEGLSWTIRLRNDGSLSWDIDLDAVDTSGSIGADCDGGHSGPEFSAEFTSVADTSSDNHDGLVHVAPGMYEDVLVTVTLDRDAGNACQGDEFSLMAVFTATEHAPWDGISCVSPDVSSPAVGPGMRAG